MSRTVKTLIMVVVVVLVAIAAIIVFNIPTSSGAGESVSQRLIDRNALDHGEVVDAPVKD